MMRSKLIEGGDGRDPRLRMGPRVRLVTGNMHNEKKVRRMKKCSDKDILTTVAEEQEKKMGAERKAKPVYFGCIKLGIYPVANKH